MKLQVILLILTVLANYKQEQWPEICYWFSQNKNPIREEVSIFGQDQNNERHTDILFQNHPQRYEN